MKLVPPMPEHCFPVLGLEDLVVVEQGAFACPESFEAVGAS